MKFPDLLKRCASTIYPEAEDQNHHTISDLTVKILSDKLPPASRVLDIGVGNGYGLQKLKELGHNPVGLAISEEEIRRAGKLGFTVFALDMHDISPAIGIFDGAFARHVLEHSPCPLLVLSNLFEVIRPGGFMYVEVPSPGTACKHESNPNHYTVLSLDAWVWLLKKAGFTPEIAYCLPVLTNIGLDAYFSILCKR